MALENGQARPGLGPHATQAVNHLAQGKVGDQVTREQMAAIIGRSCKLTEKDGAAGLGNVRSAIDHVEREHGIVWCWSRARQAWICLSDSERLDVVRKRKTSGCRQLKRSNRVAGCIDEQRLPADDRQDLKLLTIQNSLALASLDKHLTNRLAAGPNTRRLAIPDYDKLSQILVSGEG